MFKIEISRRRAGSVPQLLLKRSESLARIGGARSALQLGLRHDVLRGVACATGRGTTLVLGLVRGISAAGWALGRWGCR